MELEALLLSVEAWVASPSPLLSTPLSPCCLTETVCTRLGALSCPVATWHMYSPASDAWNNKMTVFANV